MKNLKYVLVAVFGFAMVGIMSVHAAAYVDESTMPEGNAFMGWYQDTTVQKKDETSTFIQFKFLIVK